MIHRVGHVPTAFQRRVYTIVRQIPEGEVRSYRWVASRLGNPQLARAVGQALKRNPCLRRACDCGTSRRGRQAWPLRVPCHRVIRTDGSLGGYAWGVAKKRQLLRQEARRRHQKTGVRRQQPSRRSPFSGILGKSVHPAGGHPRTFGFAKRSRGGWGQVVRVGGVSPPRPDAGASRGGHAGRGSEVPPRRVAGWGSTKPV